MIADKIGNYKVVLIGSIIATGGFHTLLLTIDAHGINPTNTVTNRTQSSVSAFVYLSCDQSGRTLLKLPNNIANSTCPYENLSLREKPMIHLMSSECVQSCNGTTSSIDLCLATDDTDCYDMDGGVLLQLGLGNESLSNSSSDLCTIPVNEIMLKNSSQSAVLGCDCPIECPAFITDPSWISCPILNETSPSTEEFDHAKHQRGFWTYLVIRVLATAALGTSFTMLDTTTICLIKKYNGQLGRQRLFGVLGSAAFAFSTGIMLDWAASLNNGKLVTYA